MPIDLPRRGSPEHLELTRQAVARFDEAIAAGRLVLPDGVGLEWARRMAADSAWTQEDLEDQVAHFRADGEKWRQANKATIDHLLRALSAVQQFSSHEAKRLLEIAATLEVPRPDGLKITRDSERLDSLCCDLYVIFRHTTWLGKTPILRNVVSPIMQTIKEVYPDESPRRGFDGAEDRFDRCVKTEIEDERRRHAIWLPPDPEPTEEDQVDRWRWALFAGDDRFPRDLFLPHRPARNPEARHRAKWGKPHLEI